jgi:hypothetical protein
LYPSIHIVEACERDGIVFLPWFPLGGKGTPAGVALGTIAVDSSDSGYVVDQTLR